MTPSFKPNEFGLPLGNKYRTNMIQSEFQHSKPAVNSTQTKLSHTQLISSSLTRLPCSVMYRSQSFFVIRILEVLVHFSFFFSN